MFTFLASILVTQKFYFRNNNETTPFGSLFRLQRPLGLALANARIVAKLTTERIFVCFSVWQLRWNCKTCTWANLLRNSIHPKLRMTDRGQQHQLNKLQVRPLQHQDVIQAVKGCDHMTGHMTDHMTDHMTLCCRSAACWRRATSWSRGWARWRRTWRTWAPTRRRSSWRSVTTTRRLFKATTVYIYIFVP